MKLRILNSTEWVLFHQYPGKLQSQKAYLYLELETGRAYCDWDGEIGYSVPVDIYHNRTLRWQLPEAILGEAANALMKDCDVWLQTILDNSEIDWDGNNNVGKLNEKGADAGDQIAEHINGYHSEQLCAEVFDAQEWLQLSDVEEDHESGMSVSDIVERWTAIAQSENVHLLGTEQYVQEIIDRHASE